MHPRHLTYLASLALCVLAATGCVDEGTSQATAVPLQPTIVRPPLATPLPATPGSAPTSTSIPGAPAASPSPSVAPGGRTFTVRDGDTLSTIAGVVYSDASRWRTIFDANRDQLASEDSLQVGQTLRVPPLPTSTPTATPTRTA